MMQYVNLGCGTRYLNGWINIDFYAHSKEVISHNLLEGIPFPDEQFEVVYHSHVLEHFSKKEGKVFLKECYRVLKKGGIMRLAIPDLESMARTYIQELDKALQGDEKAELNHQWMLIELIDQMVRTERGGEMKKYFLQEKIANFDFIYQRIGHEALNIQESLKPSAYQKSVNNSPKKKLPYYLSKLLKRSSYRKFILKIFFGPEWKYLQENEKYIALGRFRLAGEVHQWMYDRLSLSNLLYEINFQEVSIQQADTSLIPNWVDFQSLDLENGQTRKPDSLFIEARK